MKAGNGNELVMPILIGFALVVLVGCGKHERSAGQEGQGNSAAAHPPVMSAVEAPSAGPPVVAKPALPPIKLPTSPRPKDVIGLPRRDVRKVLGASVTEAGDLDVVTIEGLFFQVTYKQGVAVKLSVSLNDYSPGRDQDTLLAWLGVDFTNSAVLNGRTVRSRMSGTSVHVFDESFQMVEDRRAEAADAAARKWASAAEAEAEKQAEKQIVAAKRADRQRITSSRCYASAKRLIKTGTRCGIDMSKYSAEEVCRSLLVDENFTDDKAVGRLAIQMGEAYPGDDVCGAIRISVDGDRI